MLREVGKRDPAAAGEFIARHGRHMPRTMLRYALECFPQPTRGHLLRESTPTSRVAGRMRSDARSCPRPPVRACASGSRCRRSCISIITKARRRPSWSRPSTAALCNFLRRCCSASSHMQGYTVCSRSSSTNKTNSSIYGASVNKRDARARPAEQNNLLSAPRSRRQDTMRIMSSALSNAPPLPVDVCLPPLREALAHGRHAVLQAPPGAGKTTRVPLALLQEAWMGGRHAVMLEPRRLAARAAAHYMAAQLDERVGETVGYRVRMESRVSARTRIEVVTEGVLTRMLQDDPALEDVALVIFDEFHERSLQGDLGLALCRETQGALRDDLRLLVMSATLDAAPVANWLGDAPLVTSEGRAYRVVTRYVPSDTRSTNGPHIAHLAAIVQHTITAEEGSVLVFLPGIADIKHI